MEEGAMKQVLFIICVFVLFLPAAGAGELYKCVDRDGKRIITDNPQDGMMDCVLKDSTEDSSSMKNNSKTRGVNSQCASVSSIMNGARIYLNQASNRRYSELEEAREDVRKAIEALDEAESISGSCPCPSLREGISNAAQYARQTVNQNSATQFSASLTNAIRAFNDCAESFKLCK
jgi:hypothetical protein